MVPYKLSPYIQIIENRLATDVIQYGVFHRLTGDIVELPEELRALLDHISVVKYLSINAGDLRYQGRPGALLLRLIENKFLITDEADSLACFLDHYVVRPLQNPAVGYQTAEGEVVVVRTSMAEYVLGRKLGDLPAVIEEVLPRLSAQLFIQADGTRTLRELLDMLQLISGGVVSQEAAEAIDHLTRTERQLIKLAPQREDLSDPLRPCNIIGRDLYHADESDSPRDATSSVTDFHLHGIEDGWWEFDFY